MPITAVTNALIRQLRFTIKDMKGQVPDTDIALAVLQAANVVNDEVHFYMEDAKLVVTTSPSPLYMAYTLPPDFLKAISLLGEYNNTTTSQGLTREYFKMYYDDFQRMFLKDAVIELDQYMYRYYIDESAGLVGIYPLDSTGTIDYHLIYIGNFLSANIDQTKPLETLDSAVMDILPDRLMPMVMLHAASFLVAPLNPDYSTFLEKKYQAKLREYKISTPERLETSRTDLDYSDPYFRF